MSIAAPAECDDAGAVGEGYEKGAALGEDKLRGSGDLMGYPHLQIASKIT